MKEIQGRKTREGGSPAPDFVALALSNEVIEELSAEFDATHAGLVRLLADFNADRKRWAHRDGDPDLADFRARLLKDADFKRVLVAHRRPRTSTPAAPADDLPEPDGWREALAEDPELDRFHFRAAWADPNFHARTKRYIQRRMGELADEPAEPSSLRI
jgi:hypothetical protein